MKYSWIQRMKYTACLIFTNVLAQNCSTANKENEDLKYLLMIRLKEWVCLSENQNNMWFVKLVYSVQFHELINLDGKINASTEILSKFLQTNLGNKINFLQRAWKSTDCGSNNKFISRQSIKFGTKAGWWSWNAYQQELCCSNHE